MGLCQTIHVNVCVCVCFVHAPCCCHVGVAWLIDQFFAFRVVLRGSWMASVAVVRACRVLFSTKQRKHQAGGPQTNRNEHVLHTLALRPLHGNARAHNRNTLILALNDGVPFQKTKEQQQRSGRETHDTNNGRTSPNTPKRPAARTDRESKTHTHRHTRTHTGD